MRFGIFVFLVLFRVTSPFSSLAVIIVIIGAVFRADSLSLPGTPAQFPCALTFVAPVEIHEVPPVPGFAGLATKPTAQ